MYIPIMKLPRMVKQKRSDNMKVEEYHRLPYQDSVELISSRIQCEDKCGGSRVLRPFRCKMLFSSVIFLCICSSSAVKLPIFDNSQADSLTVPRKEQAVQVFYQGGVSFLLFYSAAPINGTS